MDRFIDYILNVAKNRDYEALNKLIELEQDDYKRSMIISIVLETLLKLKEYEHALDLFKKIVKEPYRSVAIDLIVENISENKENIKRLLEENRIDEIKKIIKNIRNDTEKK